MKGKYILLLLSTIGIGASIVYYTTQQAAINFAQAHRLFVSGEHERAIPLYQKALTIDPTKWMAKKELALSYLWTDEIEKAIVLLKELLASRPDDTSLQLALAQAYSWSKQYDQALSLLNKLMKEAPTRDVQLTLAEVYVGNGEPDKALLLYETILHDDPTDLQARLNLADLLSWTKQYDEAILQYKEILRVDSANVDALEQLANVYKYTKRYSEAEALYTQCIELHPDEPQYYAALGEVLLWEKKYSEAIEWFKKGMATGDSEESELLFGKALLYSGDSEQALTVLQNVLDRFPNNLQAKMYLADSYAYTQQFDKAIQLYQEILAHKKDTLVMEKLAAALSWNRQYKESIALYDEILQERYDPEVQLQKARVIGWSRDYTRAEKEYRNLLAKRYSKNVELEMEGKIAYWASRFFAAEQKYKELLALEPTNVEVAFDLAQIYAYRQMWDQSSNEYQDILAIEPNHFRARQGLEKVDLITHHFPLDSKYRSFKALSPSRDTDIHKHQWLNTFTTPLSSTTFAQIDYNTAKRFYPKTANMFERECQIRLTHLFEHDTHVTGYYDVIEYDRLHKKDFPHNTTTTTETTMTKAPEITSQRGSSPRLLPPTPVPNTTPIPTIHTFKRHMHLYGAGVYKRASDLVSWSFNYEKQRLENNQPVILLSYTRRAYTGRVDLNLFRDLKMGIDYLYGHYSDKNHVNSPGADLVYYFSRDPERVYLLYRCWWQNFKKFSTLYWTPKHLLTNSATVGWRHFLNKGEIYFGAYEIYLDLQYFISIDSTHVVENAFRYELSYQINKRLNLIVGGSIMRSSHNVYRENDFKIGLKYYF